MSFKTCSLPLLFALALAGRSAATAQPIEVFGGYAVGKLKPANDSNRATLGGWNSSFTAYATSRFGVTTDFAGAYGTANPVLPTTGTSSSTTSTGSVSLRQYSFMAGPQLRLIRKRSFETSFRAVFGGAHGRIADNPASDQTTFAALFGSNFDVNVSRRVAIRFSPGIYLTRFGADQTQRNFRFSVGPVFRLGGNVE